MFQNNGYHLAWAPLGASGLTLDFLETHGLRPPRAAGLAAGVRERRPASKENLFAATNTPSVGKTVACIRAQIKIQSVMNRLRKSRGSERPWHDVFRR